MNIDRPIFVLGERIAAMELVRALGDTATLCAMPVNRLLSDLVHALDRCARDIKPLTVPADGGVRPPTTWYRDVQAACLHGSGKIRTVEYSALSVLRLCELFPGAQFLVVRQLNRALHHSRRLPAPEPGRILEIESESATTPGTLARALAFLGAMEPVELDLSDNQVTSSAFT